MSDPSREDSSDRSGDAPDEGTPSDPVDARERTSTPEETVGTDRPTDQRGESVELDDLGGESDHDTAVTTLAKQGGITFTGNVVNGILGFAIVMLITRFVSPSVYGLWVLATSVILFLQVFATLGLPLAIDYFVPQYLDADEPGKAKGVIVQVTATVLVTSSLVALGVAAAAPTISGFFREPAMQIVLLYLAVALPMLAIYGVLLRSFYSIKKLQYRVVMRDLVRPIVRFTTTAALLVVGFGMLGLLGGYVVGLFAAITVGAVLFTYRAWVIVSAKLETVAPGPLIRYSVPLALASVVFVLMGHVDYFVLGYYRSADDVGIYRVGYMLGSGLMIIFNSLSPVFKPLIAETREDTAAVTDRFRVMARWIAGITLPVAITISLGASSYLAVLYTPQYSAASAVVALLAAAFVFNVTFGGPDGTLLQGLGYPRIVFANTVVLFGVNFLVSVALVPIYGMEGAAIGSAAALVLVGVLTLGELYYLDGIHPFNRAFWKVVVAGVPATLAGVPVVLLVESAHLVVVTLPIVVITTYALTLYKTNAFNANDAQMAAAFSPTLRRLLPARFGENR